MTSERFSCACAVSQSLLQAHSQWRAPVFSTGTQSNDPIRFPHWFLPLICTFQVKTEEDGWSCVYMCCCACVCQNSVVVLLRRIGPMVLNPTGMIEGSLSIDRFSIISQRGWCGGHIEKVYVQKWEKRKDRDKEKKISESHVSLGDLTLY